MAKSKRVVYRVVPSFVFPGSWDIKENAQIIYRGIPKKEAVEIARGFGRECWGQGTLSQLVVHGRNGKIQFEHTYGKDPRKSKG